MQPQPCKSVRRQKRSGRRRGVCAPESQASLQKLPINFAQERKNLFYEEANQRVSKIVTVQHVDYSSQLRHLIDEAENKLKGESVAPVQLVVILDWQSVGTANSTRAAALCKALASCPKLSAKLVFFSGVPQSFGGHGTVVYLWIVRFGSIWHRFSDLEVFLYKSI